MSTNLEDAPAWRVLFALLLLLASAAAAIGFR